MRDPYEKTTPKAAEIIRLIEKLTIPDIRSLAVAIAHIYPHQRVWINSTGFSYGVYYDLPDTEYLCLPSRQLLHWMLIVEMQQREGSPTNLVMNYWERKVNALTSRRNRATPNAVRAVRILYLRRKTDLTFAQIGRRRDVKLSADAARKMHNRFVRRMRDGFWRASEKALWDYALKNGIDNLDKCQVKRTH